MSSSFVIHVGDHPSTNDNKVKGKKRRVKFPCRLCSRRQLTYIFPHIEDDSKWLGDSVISQQQPLASSQEPCLKQTLVEEVVELEPSLDNPTLPLESDENTADVSFVIFYLPSQGGIPLMVPLPSPEVCSFDWNSLVELFLPSYVPFHISIEGISSTIHWTIIDERASIIILSSMAWQGLGSPNLGPTSSQLLAFNTSINET